MAGFNAAVKSMVDFIDQNTVFSVVKSQKAYDPNYNGIKPVY